MSGVGVSNVFFKPKNNPHQFLVAPFWDFSSTTYSRVCGCHAKYVKTNTTCLFYCTRETLWSIKAYSFV